jgi:hypothetical protein
VVKPTVGRVVHYFPSPWDYRDGQMVKHDEQPFAAHIAYVHSDTMVNLAMFDHNGRPFHRTSVEINVPGARAQWMDYQKGQAAKADKLQAELDKAAGAQGSKAAI